MFDRPVQGRVFFEEVIRENVGRPDHVQLIFDRRVTRRTPSRCRVITEGVTPSLHVDYKHSRIKQYHKEGRALRTETVVNDTYDFGIGRRLCNLDALKQIGFAANRRLLCVQRISHDSFLGTDISTPSAHRCGQSPCLRPTLRRTSHSGTVVRFVGFSSASRRLCQPTITRTRSGGFVHHRLFI